ncbi:unnamed protein product [Boreogadus saida]
MSRVSKILHKPLLCRLKGLPLPSRQVSPIPLIGGKVQVLSVAGWWVGVVYPFLHGPSGPSRPRCQGRDATI